MTEKTFANGAVKPCCLDPLNLDVLADESNADIGLTVKRCRVCGCRHRRLHLEPGMLGVRMTPRQA